MLRPIFFITVAFGLVVASASTLFLGPASASCGDRPGTPTDVTAISPVRPSQGAHRAWNKGMSLVSLVKLGLRGG